MRLAESWTLQIFDTRMDFPVPVQSRGWLFSPIALSPYNKTTLFAFKNYLQNAFCLENGANLGKSWCHVIVWFMTSQGVHASEAVFTEVGKDNSRERQHCQIDRKYRKNYVWGGRKTGHSGQIVWITLWIWEKSPTSSPLLYDLGNAIMTSWNTRVIWKVLHINPLNFTQWSEHKDE